jgi:hypothetical protein
MSVKLLLLACAMMLLTITVFIVAQDLNGKDLHLRTRLVVIDALVKEQRTDITAADLSRDNFVVLDDGKPRTLTHFGRGTTSRQPLAITVILDLRPGGAGRFFRQADISRSLAGGLAKLLPEDEVSVVATWVKGLAMNQRRLVGFTRES